MRLAVLASSMVQYCSINACCEPAFHQSSLPFLVVVCLGLTLCDGIPAVRPLFASHSLILLCCDCLTVCLQATNSSACTLSQQRCFYVLTKVQCTCFARFVAVVGIRLPVN